MLVVLKLLIKSKVTIHKRTQSRGLIYKKDVTLTNVLTFIGDSVTNKKKVEKSRKMEQIGICTHRCRW